MTFSQTAKPPVRRFTAIGTFLILGAICCFETTVAPSAAAITSARNIQVTVSSSTVTAGGFVIFTATISTPNPTAATIVKYSMIGSANIGRDYIISETPGRFVIPAGVTSASIKLTALTNGRLFGKKAKLTLKSGGGYSLSSPASAIVQIAADTVGSISSPARKREVWIGIRSDNAFGKGTQRSPYNGNSAARFDATMSKLQGRTNLLIHLPPGTFKTSVAKTWFLRSGWVIQGAGMYKTIIRLTGNLAGMHYGVACLRSDPNVATDKVIIRDLTLDCNWAELSTTADAGADGEKNVKTGAVAIWGSNNLIERTLGINSYGSAANLLEQFVFSLGGPRSADGTNNIIRFCRAESPQGNYGNPFGLSGWGNSPPTHILTNSKVVACTAIGINNGRATGFTSGGVNIADVRDCQIDSNTFIDCYGAAYIDTGSCDGVSVTNNTVIRGWQGVGISNSVLPKKNIQISGNSFLIQNRVVGGGSYAIVLASGPATNVRIEHNTVNFDGSGHGLLQFWGIVAGGLSSATISNNTVDSSLPSVSKVEGTAITLQGNRHPDGTLAPGLHD